ncbi:MAG: hypothetical protein WC531_03140 [Candidatus Paceibacterota bacterium]|jgi:hypothetical protein
MVVSSKTEILRSSRERAKKRRNTKRAVGMLVIFVIVGGFVLLLNLNFLRLTTFSLLGQTSQDLSALKQTVREQLDGYYFGLVPQNSIFFFSKNNLIVLLKQKFPGLQSVEIDSPNLNTLAIKVTDRETKVLWCNGLASQKHCYYLNDEGLVYQLAPNFSESIILEFNSSTTVTKLNSAVIDPIDLERAKTFISFLKSTLTDWPRRSLGEGGLASIPQTYKLAYVVALPLKDFEAVMVSNANPDDPTQSWKLIFNTGASADQLITNFHSLIKDPTLTKDWAHGSTGSLQAKSLDYLDLRFNNKVFYRFK